MFRPEGSARELPFPALPVLLLPSARCRKHLIGPAFIDVLRSKVGFVGAVIPAESHVPLSQRLELLQPV